VSASFARRMVISIGQNCIGLKLMASAKKKSKSNGFSRKPKRTGPRRVQRFAVCIKGTGFDLIAPRVYRVIEVTTAARKGWLRVIDESGEDYLYPASCFVMVRPEKKSESRLAAALRISNSRI
jgi:hypothetical protein